jgi:hypothetical protein
MYCLPLDDACQWEKLQYELVARPAENQKINALSFELGTFNGRIFTYVWNSERPIIFIEDANTRPIILRGD